MKRQILSGLKNTADKYKNEEFLLDIVKNWNPQTMFKYIELYDKKQVEKIFLYEKKIYYFYLNKPK